ncbi:MAG: dockerin type I repeat-containing protein, partial [Oscillospiraceae bacterium]|nr:dockerin type I repeat-containing protein [Oscillospiraceae bacterium]
QSSGCINYTVIVTLREKEPMLGDVNADNEFSIADAVLMQKWLAAENVTLANMTAGDLCDDERLNIFDLNLMKRELIHPTLTTTTATTTTTTTTTTVTTIAPSDRDFRFNVSDGLFDQSNTDTLSLAYPEGLETYTVWKADDSSDHYCNGV